jgi:hypothetical protein
VSGPAPEGVIELDAVVIGGCGHVGLPLATGKPVADIPNIRGQGVRI